MKIFFDTNVLAAAFGTRGLCLDLLKLTIQTNELVLGEPVAAELRRVLPEKFRMPPARVERLLGLLREYYVALPVDMGVDVALRDPGDRLIVLSAIAGQADVLVTGDRDLLEADLPIRVMTPRELWLTIRHGLRADMVHELSSRRVG
ncbi:MAG TPA: putative toxin-antitoxin system toxin component, PIN family [Thermoanaerobaculia bacterium]|nr:putative toxin-antitoxin system toxin component, PIN family [Thermoanaerobaculia bacterium]